MLISKLHSSLESYGMIIKIQIPANSNPPSWSSIFVIVASRNNACIVRFEKHYNQMNYNSANADTTLFHKMRYFGMQVFFHCPSNSIMWGVEYSAQVHTMCHLNLPFLLSVIPLHSPHPLKKITISK